MVCWNVPALGMNTLVVLLTAVRSMDMKTLLTTLLTTATPVLSACFWAYVIFFSFAALPPVMPWLMASVRPGMVFQPAKAAAGLALMRRLLQQLTLLLGLSWAQSAAGDAVSRGRLPAPLPACTWAITLPALPAYCATVALTVAGLGGVVLLYCALYWRGGGAVQAAAARCRVCAALDDVWAPLDLLMLWGAFAVAHAANVGLRHWVQAQQ